MSRQTSQTRPSRARPAHPTLIALFAGLALAPAPAALAQNALGDGTSLDRNLMRGGNGKNSRVRDVQATINFNNAIVTGNAPFGRSIRGGGQNRAVGDYSGSAGSSGLFRFERDSFASGLVASGGRGTDALRYQFALATGSYVPAVVGDVGAVTVQRIGSGQGTFPATNSLRSTADFLATQAIRPSVAGYRRGEDGSMYTATASPLLGVGWMRTDTRVPGQIPTSTRIGSTAIPETPPLIPGQPQPAPDPVNPSFQQPEAPTREDIARFDRSRSGLTGLEPGALGLPNSLRSSALMDTRAGGQRVDSRSEEHTRLMRAIDTAFDPTAAPGEPTASRPRSPWERELDTIRMRLSTEEQRPDPLAPGIAAPGTPGATPGRTADPLVPSGIHVAPGVRGPEDPTPEGADPDTPEPAAEPGLDYLAQSLGVDVKTMRALRDAGVRFERLSDPRLADQPNYRRHMAAGEQQLGAGRFFDAEDRFLRAMSALPGDPMAQVGRLHAQLGAGLFLSAALNLRQIFTDHPEMVAAKYAAALRPDDERTAKIATNLREEMLAEESALGRDSALLLAYLGHITDDGAMVHEGLEALVERTPEDDTRDLALVALLKGVWGDQPGEAKDGK